MARPEPLTITNLIARKVSECGQVLRWDNDQYDKLCGYRVSIAETKNSPDIWRWEWPAEQFPKTADHHYLLVWIEGLSVHSRIVVRVAAHSADRHGAPRAIHLAGWHRLETRVGEAEKRDPSAPLVLVRDPARPEIPPVNLFEHNCELTWDVNLPVDEILPSKYSQVSEWTGRDWLKVNASYVKNNNISGHDPPMSYPARVEDMLLEVPRSNPEIHLEVTVEIEPSP